MYFQDTIAAISTPLGSSGIGMVRLSGTDAINVANRVFVSPKGKKIGDASHVVCYGYVVNPDTGNKIDEVLVSFMRAPSTYTREDVVEFNCHGGIIPLREVLSVLLMNGARLAEPGEFTRRAFLNGRIDLAQAEAVIDIINSRTEASLKAAMHQVQGALSEKINEIMEVVLDVLAQLEAAVDFSDEDVEILPRAELGLKINDALQMVSALLNEWESGRVLRDGVRTTIIGRPNVGKSSLLNALLREKRCIVTSTPGTTRDVIEETISINGVPIIIHDTAGIRHPESEAEQMGVEFARKSLLEAELVLFVVDSSEHLGKEDVEIGKELKNKKAILVLNKSDLPKKLNEKELEDIYDFKKTIKISATKGEGIKELEEAMGNAVFSGGANFAENVLLTNVRHKKSLVKTHNGLRETQKALKENESEEFVVVPLRDAAEGLGEIIGKVTDEDLLDRIFSQFCIGK